MKFVKQNQTAGYHITCCDTDHVIIDNKKYSQSLLVSIDQLLSPWPVFDVASLTQQQLQPMLAMQPGIFLLGTGQHQQFLSPAMQAFILSQGIGLEVAPTPAICKTYNALVSEQRPVVAGLLFGESLPLFD